MHRIGLGHLRYLVETAVRIDRAVGGLIQLYDEHERVLRLHTVQGFSDSFATAVRVIPISEETTCAQAARDRRHVVVRDVHADPAFQPYLHFAQLGNFRSIQSTPLIDTRRRMVGVLTTQFPTAHHPGRESLDALGACARVAARVIEAWQLHDDVGDADKALGIPRRALSVPAAQAADAVRMLLPVIARDGDLTLLATTERHLDALISELSGRLRPVVGATG